MLPYMAEQAFENCLAWTVDGGSGESVARVASAWHKDAGPSELLVGEQGWAFPGGSPDTWWDLDFLVGPLAMPQSFENKSYVTFQRGKTEGVWRCLASSRMILSRLQDPLTSIGTAL